MHMSRLVRLVVACVLWFTFQVGIRLLPELQQQQLDLMYATTVTESFVPPAGDSTRQEWRRALSLTMPP